jgi:hypothetical protein
MIAVIILILAALLLAAGYFVSLGRKSKRRQIESAKESVSYDVTLEKAINDVAQMIAYASRSGKSLDKKDIQAIVEAQRAGKSITSEQEAAFWTSASAISHAIAPVTVETLRSSYSASENDESLAGLAARAYRIRTIITLIALLFFQVYWLIGATVTSDLKDIRAHLEKLQAESQNGKVAIAALDDKDAQYKEKKAKLDADEAAWGDKLWADKISAWADFEVLKKWNVAKHLFIEDEVSSAPSSNKSTARDQVSQRSEKSVDKSDYFLWVFTPDHAEEMQTAQMILTALLKYILPILYGALGASAYIVRSLAAEIKDSTYSAGSVVRYELRFYLGAVAGLSIAWFTSDAKSAEGAGILQSLSPLALAFLAGYSVELLFSLLDRFVSAFSGPEPKRVP